MINSREEDEFVAGMTQEDAVWLGMKMKIGSRDASWELLDGKEPSFNKISDYDVLDRFTGSHYYSSLRTLCAVARMGEWIPLDCSRGSVVDVACKRPIAG